MPLLIAPIPLTLNQMVSLQPDSSPQLCSEVKKSTTFKQPLKPAKNQPAPPSAKPPTPISLTVPVQIRAIDALEVLGLAMLPPQHVQQHLASWHWTLIRYAYLIEPRPPSAPLRLNDLVGEY